MPASEYPIMPIKGKLKNFGPTPVCIIKDEPTMSDAIIRLKEMRFDDFSSSLFSSLNPRKK